MTRDSRRLGIGLVGSGFNAGFHLQAFRAVRDADVRGVWSPSPANASRAAARATALDVGDARPFASLGEMASDPAIDALWLTGPNHRRVENVEEIVAAVARGRGNLRAIACEKPLARNVAEAERIVALVRGAGLAHGYLENQVFAPQVEAGREHVEVELASDDGGVLEHPGRLRTEAAHPSIDHGPDRVGQTKAGQLAGVLLGLATLQLDQVS